MNQRNDATGSQCLPFEEWKSQLSPAIISERFWQLIAYQKALFLYDLVWKDTSSWLSDIRGHELARQIVRSTGSITANIEEGYGRGLGKQLVYFYSVSLGSARETKGWYYRAKAMITPKLLEERLALLSEIIALLITEINRQKQYAKEKI